MKPYIPANRRNPRPGCPCCKSGFMDGYNDRSQATKNAHRAGKKAARRENKKAIQEY